MDGDYYTAAGKATLRNAKISDAQLNAYLSDKANQSSDPQRAEKMMTALMNVQGDITKLPKTRGDAGTFSFREVNDFFASR